MTDRDVKKMSRKELLELLIASKEENAELKERLEQQEAQLQSREIQIKKRREPGGSGAGIERHISKRR